MNNWIGNSSNLDHWDFEDLEPLLERLVSLNDGRTECGREDNRGVTMIEIYDGSIRASTQYILGVLSRAQGY